MCFLIEISNNLSKQVIRFSFVNNIPAIKKMSDSAHISDLDALDDYMKANDEELERENERERLEKRAEYEERMNHMNFKEYSRAKLYEGLQQPLSKNNIGYQLLKKMGYSDGDGLGKDGSGIKEPIELTIRSHNSGVGIEIKSKSQIVEEHKKKSEERMKQFDKNVKVYYDRVKEKGQMKLFLRDMHNAQRTCQHLDESKGIERNKFWLSEDGESDGFEYECSEDVQRDLNVLLKYLRNTHNYCFYCGCEYDSPEELSEKCPGITRKDHD